ncbi:MAG: hypothetical protein ACR2GY_05345 [Phycisphaerales bacterium]
MKAIQLLGVVVAGACVFLGVGWMVRTSPRTEVDGQRLAIISGSPELLGPLPVMARAERRVLIRNVSEATIELELFGLSCSCVDTAFSQTLLGPLEECSFRMWTMVEAEQGVQHHFAVIRARGQRDSGFEDLTVHMVFDSDVPYIVQPQRLIVHHRSDRQGRAFCIIVPKGASEISVVRARHDLGSDVHLTTHPVAAGSGQGVELRLTSGLSLGGVVEGHVQVVTDSERHPEFTLPVSIRVDPPEHERPLMLVLDANRSRPGAHIVSERCNLGRRDPAEGELRILQQGFPRGLSAWIEVAAQGDQVLHVAADFRAVQTMVGSFEFTIVSENGQQHALVTWIGPLEAIEISGG